MKENIHAFILFTVLYASLFNSISTVLIDEKVKYVILAADISAYEPAELKEDNYDFGLYTFKITQATVKEVTKFEKGATADLNEITINDLKTADRIEFKINFGDNIGDALCISAPFPKGTKPEDLTSTRDFTCFSRFYEKCKGKSLELPKGTCYTGIKTGDIIFCLSPTGTVTTVDSSTCTATKLTGLTVDVKERERSVGMNKGGLIATPIVLVLALLGVVGFAFSKRKVEQDDKPDVEVNAEESTNQKANLHRSDADNYVDSKQPLKTFKKGKTTAY